MSHPPFQAFGVAADRYSRPAIAVISFSIHSFLLLVGKLCLINNDSGILHFHAGIVAGGSCVGAFIMIYFAYIMSYFCIFQEAIILYNNAHGNGNLGFSPCSASVDTAIGNPFTIGLGGGRF